MENLNPISLAPEWLETMLKTKFFAPCDDHPDMPRNECNLFCADCAEISSAFCVYCKSNHQANHRIIQIRKSSYHEVVRVAEVEELIDVKGLHTYIINSAKVFFLNERPQLKGVGAAAGKAAASPYFCEVCSRSLLYEFRFCSIGCKLERIKADGDATFLLDEYDQSSSSNGVEGVDGRRLMDAQGGEGSSMTNDTKPKSLRPPNRSRKGIPHRAPFF